MSIVTTAEVKGFLGITDTSQDTVIAGLIPGVQGAIESYCDRKFDYQTNYQWFHYSPKNIVLPQYPVRNIKFIGTPDWVCDINYPTGNYSFNIQLDAEGNVPTSLNVNQALTLSTNTYAFSTFTTLGALGTQVTTDFPDVSFAIQAGYTNLNTKLLRSATGDKMYGAKIQNVIYRIEDLTERILTIPIYATVNFTALDYYFDATLLVVWDSGWNTNEVPVALKMIMSNIISDYKNIINSSIGSGVLKSEGLGDYSYSLQDSSRIYQIIHTNYAKQLSPWKKQLI